MGKRGTWILRVLIELLDDFFTYPSRVMARVMYGTGVAEIRGKVGGSVHSRNKGGAVIRTRTTPINRNTSFQAAQRVMISSVAKAWANTLTDAQRAAWSALGEIIGARNIFGNGLILSGIATYQRINRIILAAGGSRIDNPPASLDVAAISSMSVTANHVGPVLTIAFTPTPTLAPVGLYVYATPPLSPGIQNVSSQLRLIGFFSAAASGFSIYTQWSNRFGAMPGTSGKRIAVTAQPVNLSTGAIGPVLTAGTLIL